MKAPETTNKRPPWLTAAAVAVCLIGGGLVYWNLRGASVSDIGGSAKDWYTIDDGKSYFADDVSKFVPFQYKGKPAYRCSVWTCDGGKTTFVSHLERIPPEVKKMLDSLDQKKAMVMFDPGTMEVKLPLTGDQGWVNIGTPQAEEIMKPKCPSGSTGTPTSVLAP